MRRLYLRIYLAVVASLAVFALAAGFLWRQFADTGIVRPATEIAAVLAQNALPPAQAPLAAQQAALERLAAGLHADVTLFGADDTAQAWVGDALPPPGAERSESGWLRAARGRRPGA